MSFTPFVRLCTVQDKKIKPKKTLFEAMKSGNLVSMKAFWGLQSVH